MGILLENIYDLLVQPKTALRKIICLGTLGQALQILIFSVALTCLGMYAGAVEGSGKLLIIFIQLIVSVVFWGVGSAVWHLLAELVGGIGSAKNLLIAMGFIYFLQILVLPFYLLAEFAADTGVVLLMLASVAIAIWSISLQVIAISVNYNISTARAALVWFLPLLIFLGLIIVIGIAAGSFIMAAVSQLPIDPTQF